MKLDWVSIPNDTSKLMHACLHGRLNWGLRDHGEWKSHSGLKVVSDSCTDDLIFPAILLLIPLNTWIKLLILQTILFRPWWTSNSFRVSFKSEISIQVYMIPNRRHFTPDWVFNPEWKMERTRSGTSCNSIRIHVNKYNSIPYDLNGIGISSIRIGTQFRLT